MRTIKEVSVLEFNWGVFWAILAALTVRGAYKFVSRMWRIGNFQREVTLRDVWELM